MELLDLASTQHAAFSRDQSRRLGWSDDQLKSLVRNGIVSLCSPEVFRVCGAPVTWRQRLMVATLSIPGSMASHRASGRLWDLKGFDLAPVEVVVERWHRRHRVPRGAVVHETKDLKAIDIDERDGIPCTSLVRTLIDLPAVCHEFKAGVALDQATRQDPLILERVGQRHLEVARRGRNGTAKLRQLLAERGEGAVVDSGFERKALRLIHDSGLPRPATQFRIRDGDFCCYLDLAWPDRLVGMECDSLEHHLSERAFRWERKRRRALHRLGWTILEFTYREVTQDEAMVLRELRHHLLDREMA